MSRISITTLHIFTLFAFAIAPLYDLLARYAQFFIAHNSGRSDLIFFVIVFSFILPGVISLINALLLLISKRVQRIFFISIITCLFAIIVLPILKKVNIGDSISDGPILIAALLISALIVALYCKIEKVKMLLTFALPAIIIFPLIFLFISPVSKIILRTSYNDNKQINSPKNSVKALPHIVMVIFDELPITSLMDEKHLIDEKHYPNFARLSKNAYWYRNATTVSAETIYSVPSILTGKYPSRNCLPQLSEYPNNIFTYLTKYYSLNVSENCTHLCPDNEKINKNEDLIFSDRVTSLLYDSSFVYLHLIAPKNMAKQLPAIDFTWQGFGNAKNSVISEHSRSKVFNAFVDSIKNNDTPTFNMIHINIPHFPWIFYPSGKMYGNYGQGTGGINGLNQQWWTSDKWLIVQAMQRHLLQVEFTDKLLGDLIKKLKEEKIYKSSIVIVTADHGVSFRANDHLRSITENNYSDIISVPLFIKLPNQEDAVIQDRNAETIDIFPTVAKILGIPIPWNVDGNFLLGGQALERKKNIVFNGPWVKGELNKRYVYDLNNGEKYDTLIRKNKIFEDGIYKIGRYKNMVGHEVNEYYGGDISKIKIKLDYENLTLDNGGSDALLPFGNISGSVRCEGDGPVFLAIGIDGTIRAVTRTFKNRDGKMFFTSLLPESAFNNKKYKIEIYEIDNNKKIKLNQIQGLWEKRISTILTKKDDRELIIRSNEKGKIVSKILIDKNAMLGRLDSIEKFEGGQLSFYGWAADVKNSMLPKAIYIFIDNKCLLDIETQLKRPGVAKSNNVPENCGFSFTIPINNLGGNTGKKPIIRIFAVSENDVASEINYPFQDIYRPTYPNMYIIKKGKIVSNNGKDFEIKNMANKGRLDVALEKPGKIMFSGWAVDIENRTYPDSILIFSNKKFIYSVRTSHYRKNIAKKFGINEFDKIGFIFEIPKTKIDKQSKIELYAVSRSGMASELDYYDDFKWK